MAFWGRPWRSCRMAAVSLPGQGVPGGGGRGRVPGGGGGARRRSRACSSLSTVSAMPYPLVRSARPPGHRGRTSQRPSRITPFGSCTSASSAGTQPPDLNQASARGPRPGDAARPEQLRPGLRATKRPATPCSPARPVTGATSRHPAMAQRARASAPISRRRCRVIVGAGRSSRTSPPGISCVTATLRRYHLRAARNQEQAGYFAYCAPGTAWLGHPRLKNGSTGA